MFDDKEGLRTEVKFAVGAVYEEFSKKWGILDKDKLSWVDTWSEILSPYRIDTINKSLKHCIAKLKRHPSVFEFREYCKRVESNKNLNDPYFSAGEERARKIIELSREFGCTTFSELEDACLIAASIAASRTNREANIPWNNRAVDIHFLSRARMFACESVFWTEEAEEERGYWSDILKLNTTSLE